MKAQETSVLGGLLVAFIVIPYLPQEVLLLADNILVRILLLAGLIAAAYVGPVAAVAAFAVVAYLYMERNRAKLGQLTNAMNLTSNPLSPAIQSIQSGEYAPPQPDFQPPLQTSLQYAPQDDSGSDQFEPVAATLNEKTPLPTEASNDGVNKAISQLFEWVNPNLAQAP
jgi:hypothetical protein